MEFVVFMELHDLTFKYSLLLKLLRTYVREERCVLGVSHLGSSHTSGKKENS